MVGTVQVRTQLACNTSALPRWITKLSRLDKGVEVEDLYISGGTRGTAKSKAFPLTLSSKILSGLEASYSSS